MGKKTSKSRDRELEPEDMRVSDGNDIIHPEGGAEEERVFGIGKQIDPKRLKYLEKDKIIRKKVSGRRIRTLSSMRGTYIRARIPSEKIRDVALDATIRAASCHMRSRSTKGCRIRIESQDIREKVRIGKISTPTVFVVDASGSMFTYERMASAKGAVFSLLVDSYQKRDKVGLVAFREHKAEEVLPMCSSLDLGIKYLKDLASGGPTPLSAGLQKGLEVLMLEKRKNPESLPVLVLISDGRANVPLTTFSPIEEELVNLTNQAWKHRIHMIFIDVEQTATASRRHGNYKKILMDRMAYYHIERLTPDMIRDIVAQEKGMLISALS